VKADAPPAERVAAVRAPNQAAEAVNRGLFMGPTGMPPRGPRQATVRVIDAEGRTEERRVEIGIGNRVQVQILSGLAEGDEVIAGLRQPAGAASGARGSQGAGQQRSGLQGGGGMPMMPPGGPR
jgi:macrolide-specific efflux system membrane fusion protein